MNRIPIESIRVGGSRRPLGDITALAASIEEVGLLNPVTVRADGDGYLLIAGLHRLEAARSIGWLEIEAVVVDLCGLEAELAEIDENLCRNDLTTLERAEQLARRKAIYLELHPETRAGTAGAMAKHGSANETVSFAEDVARKTGQTERAIQQHVQIAASIPADVRDSIRDTETADSTTQLLTLARQEPETQRAVAERIVSGSAPNVQQALTDIRRETRVEKMAAPPLSDSADLYPVIYADPPWRYEFSQVDAWAVENHYPTMTVGEICALDIPATENAVLFLWGTSPKLLEALAVMEAWGFTYKAMLVWDKQRPGMGYWCLNQHELLLVGTRGDVPPPKPDARFPSIISQPRGEHSEKPAEMRRRIEAMYPDLPRVELFARERVDGWACWGNEGV